MNISRIDRLLKIVTQLHSGRSLSVEDLARETGVNRRTIFRDLEVLDRAGAPFKFDRREQRYKLTREFFVPPVDLTLEECLSLMFMTQKMISRDVSPNYAAALKASIKLESTLPNELQGSCTELLRQMDFNMTPVSPVDGLTGHLCDLQSAIVEQRKTKIRYEPPTLSAFDDVLHPYHVAFIRRAWYVIGLSENDSAVRTFKIERIGEYQLLPERFEDDQDFDLAEYFGNAWSMIRGEQSYHVKIRFEPYVATNVEEVMWHKTQSTVREEDDSLIFEVDVDGVEEISWWVLGYGDQAVVLEPPELREIIRARAKEMCRSYDSLDRDLAGADA